MIAGTLRASTGGANETHASANHLVAMVAPPAIAFSAGNSAQSYGVGESVEHTPPLRAGASGTNQVPTIAKGAVVRKLTPTECERLQGFPDGWTAVLYRGKPATDAPRYKALGNSMAVPVMRWIGRRIQIVDRIVNVIGGAA